MHRNCQPRMMWTHFHDNPNSTVMGTGSVFLYLLGTERKMRKKTFVFGGPIGGFDNDVPPCSTPFGSLRIPSISPSNDVQVASSTHTSLNPNDPDRAGSRITHEHLFFSKYHHSSFSIFLSILLYFSDYFSLFWVFFFVTFIPLSRLDRCYAKKRRSEYTVYSIFLSAPAFVDWHQLEGRGPLNIFQSVGEKVASLPLLIFLTLPRFLIIFPLVL